MLSAGITSTLWSMKLHMDYQQQYILLSFLLILTLILTILRIIRFFIIIQTVKKQFLIFFLAESPNFTEFKYHVK